jgi:hypothetical protein
MSRLSILPPLTPTLSRKERGSIGLRRSQRISFFSSNDDGFVKSSFPFPWWEGMKGRGTDNLPKFLYSPPSPPLSPVEGEGVFLIFSRPSNNVKPRFATLY